MVTYTSHPRSRGATAWRFLIVGGSNTLATSALLVLLSYFVAGWLAYTIAFGAGLIFSTILASRWVFTSAGSPRATVLYVVCYIAIYLIGLAAVAAIRSFDWLPFLNVLSVFVTAPLGFVAGRFVFRNQRREETVSD